MMRLRLENLDTAFHGIYLNKACLNNLPFFDCAGVSSMVCRPIGCANGRVTQFPFLIGFTAGEPPSGAALRASVGAYYGVARNAATDILVSQLVVMSSLARGF